MISVATKNLPEEESDNIDYDVESCKVFYPENGERIYVPGNETGKRELDVSAFDIFESGLAKTNAQYLDGSQFNACQTGDKKCKKKKSKKKGSIPEGSVIVGGRIYKPGEIIPRRVVKPKYAPGEIIRRKDLGNKIVPIMPSLEDAKKKVAKSVQKEKELKKLTKELYELYAKREHINETLQRLNYRKHKNIAIGAELNYKLDRVDDRIAEIELIVGPKKYRKPGKVKQTLVRVKNKIVKKFKSIRKKISEETWTALSNIAKMFIPVIVPVMIGRIMKPATN